MMHSSSSRLNHLRQHHHNHNNNHSTSSSISEIVIPGPFVVLQGNAGDGLSNTIETLPKLSSSSSRQHRNSRHTTRATETIMEEDNDNSQQQDTSHASSAVVSPPRGPPPPLGRLATSTANNMRVVVGGSSSQHTSQVVTDAESSTSTTTRPVISPHDQASIKEWKQKCYDNEIQQRREWKESLQQVPTPLLDHCMMITQDMWWLSTTGDKNNKLAILRDIPTQLRNGTILRDVIGSVSPGTTIIGKDIIHLNSQTLQRIHVNPIKITTTSNNNNNNNHM